VGWAGDQTIQPKRCKNPGWASSGSCGRIFVWSGWFFVIVAKYGRIKIIIERTFLILGNRVIIHFNLKTMENTIFFLEFLGQFWENIRGDLGVLKIRRR
jgi:hypothetical protein